jgi:hypothetical protein
MKLALWVPAILLWAGGPARAHRLDEYLQGTIVSIEKDRIDVQITLTPGVAVFHAVIGEIDANGDGLISGSEQRAYAGRVLEDLTLAIDGQLLRPRLVSLRFPAVEEIKAGAGEIQIEFDASLPLGGANRKLTIENHHQNRISAYQVNCLVPRDPAIRILAQNRNYSQSSYQLDYEQTESAKPGTLAWLTGNLFQVGVIALLLVGGFRLAGNLWRRAHLADFRSRTVLLPARIGSEPPE